MEKIKVELTERDFVEFTWTESHEVKDFKMVGCARFLDYFHNLRQKYGKDISTWKLPDDDDHVGMLLRELILKVRQKWNFPYVHVELCHCRNVSTRLVDEAIISGAHTPEEISRLTLASTGCGTCKVTVQKIIEYRLKEGKSN